MPALLPHANVAVANLRPSIEDEDSFYPCSDGKPMADNTWQAEAIIAAASDLAVALPEPFVAANILVYLEQGNRDNRVAPDVLVAFGIGRRHRMSYLVWREGKPPDWVLEVASPRTEARDREHKREVYRAIGVPEYWLFDPMGVFPPGTPRLQGLALAATDYKPIEPCAEGGRATIHSDILGLDLCADGDLIRFRDPASGRQIRHHAEAEAAAKREAARAEQAAAELEAAQARAEARIQELEAALGRSRSGNAGP